MIAYALCVFAGFVGGVVLTDRRPDVAEHVVDELVKASTSSEVRAILDRLLGVALVVVVAFASACSSTPPRPDARPDARAADAALVDAEQLAPCALDASVVPCACQQGGICRTATTSDACAHGATCGP